MNRKIILVLLVLVAALAFVGCNNAAEDTTGGTTGGTTTTTTYLSGKRYDTSDRPSASFVVDPDYQLIFAATGNSVDISNDSKTCTGTYTVTGTELKAGSKFTIKGLTTDVCKVTSETFKIVDYNQGVLTLMSTTDGYNTKSVWGEK